MKKFLAIAISILFVGLTVFLSIYFYNKYKTEPKSETSIKVIYENENSVISNNGQLALVGAGEHKFNVTCDAEYFDVKIYFNNDVDCTIKVVDGQNVITMPATLMGEISYLFDVKLSYDYFILTFEEGITTTKLLQNIFSEYDTTINADNLDLQFAFIVRIKAGEEQFNFSFFYSDDNVLILETTEIVI